MKKINMDNYHGMKYPKGAIFLGSNPALALMNANACLTKVSSTFIGHHRILRHNQEFQRELRRIYQVDISMSIMIV